MMWTGSWRRPHSYGDPADEAQNVHDALGVIDVSTLGKLLVAGPGRGASSSSGSTPTASPT